jgi:hypothetical protein
VKVIAMIQTVPPDNAGAHELATREVTAEAATYEGAVAHLREQVHDGERIVTLRAKR